jgi:hypothetical protein
MGGDRAEDVDGGLRGVGAQWGDDKTPGKKWTALLTTGRLLGCHGGSPFFISPPLLLEREITLAGRIGSFPVEVQASCILVSDMTWYARC